MSHLRVLDLPADAFLRQPPRRDLCLELGEDRHDLVLLRGLLPRHRAAAVVEAVEAERSTLPWVPQDDAARGLDQVCLLGCALTPYGAHPTGPPLDAYLDEAERFRRLYARLLAPRVDVLALALGALQAAAAGRPVRPPTGPDGRAFPPATLRRMPPGHGIPTHVGRWFQTTRGYAPLLPQVRRDFQLSWFVTLQTPESGGVLEVFDLTWGAAQTPLRDGGVDRDAVAGTWPRQPFRPDAGDLLLFNGGRWYHQVTPVGGSRPRYTFGGFVGLSHDEAELLHWS